MIKPLSVCVERDLFSNLVSNQPKINAEVQNLRNIGLTQKDLILRTLAQNSDPNRPQMAEKFSEMLNLLMEGKFSEAMGTVKGFLPNDAAMIESPLGTTVMAKGWSKPVVFPKEGAFKWLGWADDPAKITGATLWEAAYGERPSLVVGAVGNSNIKPEQVLGGCSMSKKELSAMYEQAIQDFFNPIFKYFKEIGVKSEDIGFAFAHSDCGVDKAARAVVDANGLKGIATTPTEYTQYLRGVEEAATEGFPLGFVRADCPYPTVLTRNMSQIEDYALIYSKLVGKDNPLAVIGGGEHAFVRDAREALIGREGSLEIPVDIMKDKFGIVIPATNENNVVTNAARNILERVNGNPYEQFKYAFRRYLPDSPLKSDIEQYDPQMAFATAMHSQLSRAGKIPQ